MITEDYVSFETAKLLKEKGFDEALWASYDIDGYFDNDHALFTNKTECDGFECVAPTQQMAMKWLREKGWVICVMPLTFYCGEKVNSWGYNIWADDNLEVDDENTPKFTTYEEACEAAIKYCLENLI